MTLPRLEGLRRYRDPNHGKTEARRDDGEQVKQELAIKPGTKIRRPWRT